MCLICGPGLAYLSRVACAGKPGRSCLTWNNFNQWAPALFNHFLSNLLASKGNRLFTSAGRPWTTNGGPLNQLNCWRSLKPPRGSCGRHRSRTAAPATQLLTISRNDLRTSENKQIAHAQYCNPSTKIQYCQNTTAKLHTSKIKNLTTYIQIPGPAGGGGFTGEQTRNQKKIIENSYRMWARRPASAMIKPSVGTSLRTFRVVAAFWWWLVVLP